ncbi:ArsR family transcriptional regulator [Brucella endophytica]|uniref:ArsR family transcriptional regulator n=1 Tax=Brucella endophytica TaxID=1963359 RepID=A0A916S7E1_9HYPH|nr:helix-turn-helix transcriptional regulator [Brucella endophytica]GGA84343.1 ArsR family transcriptional regulator [Brucella endophytica]
MKDGPVIAKIAALIGDPARANMLTALMDGRALTASELAGVAGVTLPTASGHLAKLGEASLTTMEKQGRHRYFRLSGPDVAEVLEGLMGLAQRTGAVRVRTGPKDEALRKARICYDHLAGERGVELLDASYRLGLIEGEEKPALTEKGRGFFSSLGLDVPALEKAKRPLCRHCLDWSERRNHLSGGLGAALLDHFIAQGWARREKGRVISFSPSGAQAFRSVFSMK